jgi:cytochrome c553
MASRSHLFHPFAIATLCVVMASGAAAQVPDTIAERTRACTACHGKEGRATREGYFPRIAGKPAGYLYNQLVAFRDGHRSNTTMTYLVQHLSDAYLREIAQYFASLDLPYPPPPPLALPTEEAARGSLLVLHGDPARKIAACVQCHGRTLTGIGPAIPGLAGLPRDYVVGQFGAWRSGQRRAARPDCMAEITRQLNADDIAAIAGWLATQLVPADSQPAQFDELPRPLPLPCGSVPEEAPR